LTSRQSSSAAGHSPRRWFEQKPDAPAQLMAGSGNVLTYAEFDGYSQRLAGYFRSLGLTPGAHVAYATGNHELTLRAYWAAQRTGLFWTPLNKRWTAAEMAYVLNDSQAQAVIVNRDTEGTVTKALADVDHDVAVLSLDEGTDDACVASLVSVLADIEPIEAGAELEGVDAVLLGHDRPPQGRDSRFARTAVRQP
jgi:acyl-CoA synthetase (AMP-forming)/AMP-acid ligase II